MAQVTIDQFRPITSPAGNASGVPLGRVAIPPRYRDLAGFVHALGDISSSRILFDPWPGTATEEDLVRLTDGAIEFVDEHNTDAEMRLKLHEYFQAGVSLVWVIDACAETIAIHRSTKGPSRVLNIDDRLDGEAIIPGFTMSLEDLFHSYPEEMRVG